MQITAETMQTYKIWHITMLNGSTRVYLKSSLFKKNEVPFMNTSDATEKVEWPNRERQRGKGYAFS